MARVPVHEQAVELVRSGCDNSSRSLTLVPEVSKRYNCQVRKKFRSSGHFFPDRNPSGCNRNRK